jgi:two-component system LytT family response regulator
VTISVLIVEDDPAMRLVLKKALAEIEEVEVVGEAGDGRQGLQIFQSRRPRVVFIDIDLPGKNGLELAREIFDLSPWTYLIFATAYGEYRDEAFDVYAFDYLVKPFKILRIRQTMERIKALVAGKADGRMVSKFPPASKVTRRKLMVKDGSNYVLVNHNEIILITREGRDTVIYSKSGQVRTDKNLTELEELLGGYPFIRSHKGFIINLEMVRAFVPSGRTCYEVIMANTPKRPLITWEKVKELEEMTLPKK